MKFGLSLAGRELEIEVNSAAAQSDGAVLARYGDTVVLATSVSSKENIENLNFTPLSVEYREKTYAAGKIPGGFYRREGKPSEREVLTARVIDRSLRPLFPNGYFEDTQIVVWTLSADEENDPDIIGINAAAASLAISDIPFDDIVGAVRVGYANDNFVLNPRSNSEKEMLDITVSATDKSIVMVEGRANFISEKLFVDALKFAFENIKPIVRLIKMVKDSVGKPKRKFKAMLPSDGVKSKIRELGIEDIIRLPTKNQRREARRKLEEIIVERIDKLIDDSSLSDNEKIGIALQTAEELEREIIRKMVVEDGKRIDGRGYDDIREIFAKVGVLPRTHGSAIFKRGETQALTTVTLGSTEDAQLIEIFGATEPDQFKRFMFHYNFPPFSTGEVKPIRAPGRREIGHGALAEKALLPVIPKEDRFPYTIRVVSDILESNGSSSMASVCGGSLGLFDSGVPVSEHIAGVAMGMIMAERPIILTDILGDEDHIGDMDFKIAGSQRGITAVQMDIKTSGISYELLAEAVKKAREAHGKILKIMEETISKPREHISIWAPRYSWVTVKPEKIANLIGPTGRNVKFITSETDSKIDVKQDGRVLVFAPDEARLRKTIELIELYTQDVEVGKIYTAKVRKIIEDRGALLEFLPMGGFGFLHISQLVPKGRVSKVSEAIKIGDEVKVKVVKIENDGKIEVSRRFDTQ